MTRNLAFGVGDEGPIKAALAQGVAKNASAEYSASVERDQGRAYVRAAGSSTLRTALRLPDSKGSPEAFASSSPSPVTITVKGGEQYRGTSAEENKDWISITLTDGRKVRLRMSEVTRIEEAKAGAVRPAPVSFRRRPREVESIPGGHR